MNICKK